MRKLAIIEIALIIATIAIIGFVGFAVYRASDDMTAEPDTTADASLHYAADDTRGGAY